MNLKTLIIIPSYNESKNIVGLVDVLLSQNENTDVLVIDDSMDGTAELIKKRQLGEPRLFLIHRQGKGGRGTAILEGFKFALARDYQLIAEMDADFSHDPYEFQSLIAVSGSNTVVIGSRDLAESRIKNWPLTRTIFHKLANVYADIILGIGIKDYTNGYRIYGREALEKLDLSQIKGKGYIVLSEISYQLFKKGVQFIEVPTLFVNRQRGTSSFSLKEIQESFVSVIRIRIEYQAERDRQKVDKMI